MDPEEERDAERRRRAGDRNADGGYDVWDTNYENTEEARREAGISNEAEIFASLPLIGDGARGEIARRRAEFEAARQRRAWENLAEAAPSAEELTARYNDETFVDGGPSAWAVESEEAETGRRGMEDALAAMREWSAGGFTEADRAMMDETARREGMVARADREAAMSALEARGMGGSGATAASMLAAGEGASARGSAMHTDMLAAAQQRQFDATRAMTDIGSRMRGHDETRTGGLEAWRGDEADYARDYYDRAARRSDRERDNEADARQREYENWERATAGATNQYSTDVGSRDRERSIAEQNADDQANFIGGLLESI